MQYAHYKAEWIYVVTRMKGQGSLELGLENKKDRSEEEDWKFVIFLHSWYRQV